MNKFLKNEIIVKNLFLIIIIFILLINYGMLFKINIRLNSILKEQNNLMSRIEIGLNSLSNFHDDLEKNMLPDYYKTLAELTSYLEEMHKNIHKDK